MEPMINIALRAAREAARHIVRAYDRPDLVKTTEKGTNDFVTNVGGNGLDARLMRDYFAAFDDPAAYATSHVGWGFNPAARYEALMMYDKADTNGTELRALAGNFLYSTGANEFAGRFTRGHFDLPMRGCTISLDGTPVVIDGVLQGDLA